MKYIDISWPISPNMTAYKDKQIVHIVPTKLFDRDGAREAMITLGSHTGTHVDAPSHFLQQGAGINHVALASLIGRCTVLDCRSVQECITVADLAHHAVKKDMIILFKTRNSALAHDAPFNPNFIYLAADAARYLVEKQVKAVGIDYLGIERNQPDRATHTTLLKADIPIIEGLRLAHAHAQEYTLYCLPLALAGGDGAPARAVLIEE